MQIRKVKIFLIKNVLGLICLISITCEAWSQKDFDHKALFNNSQEYQLLMEELVDSILPICEHEKIVNSLGFTIGQSENTALWALKIVLNMEHDDLSKSFDVRYIDHLENYSVFVRIQEETDDWSGEVRRIESEFYQKIDEIIQIKGALSEKDSVEIPLDLACRLARFFHTRYILNPSLLNKKPSVYNKYKKLQDQLEKTYKGEMKKDSINNSVNHLAQKKIGRSPITIADDQKKKSKYLDGYFGLAF